ncbi:hypothetical protein [Streptomyces salinarius]|uniref:hypothetical protein n=1 Tax=Streptomyces salinarius TaxID=2762598 RepID=UPI002852A0F8|nr:hypothetical protein [Streptomyces salinarius]
MGCSCQKNREQFEVVREGGAGKVVFRSGVQSTATTVAARYPGSIVRNQKTGAVVSPGKGALELTASDGSVLLRTDDRNLLAKVAAGHDRPTARDTSTGDEIVLTATEIPTG